MIVPCELELIESGIGYSVSVTKQTISPSDEIEFQNQMKNDEFDPEVRILIITQCKIPKFPRVIINHFHNLEKLTVFQSNLKSITKLELKEFKNLKIVNFGFNELVFVPGDLFQFNRHLEEIHFRNNKIKFIGAKLFDGLESLKFVDFRGNDKIDNYVSIIDESFYSNYGNRETMEALLEKIRENCAPQIDEDELAARYGMTNGGNYPGNHAEHQQQITPHSFLDDMQSFILRGEFKDFVVKVAGREFKIFKVFLAARSETFAEYLRNNPGADSMEIKGISAEDFERVMNYVNFGRQPYAKNMSDVFVAAGKLKIEGLKNVTAKALISSMKDEKNLGVLLKILNMAFEHEHNELRLNAFEEIKKRFPSRQLKDELALQPEKLKRIIDAQLMLEQQFNDLESN